MQRIALFTDGVSPYIIGGMQKHSFYLAKYFACQKVYVDLYHIHTEENKLEVAALNIFDSEEKKYIRSFSFVFPKISNFPGHYIRESYIHSVNIFNAYLKNGKVDFIYIQGFAGWKIIQEKKRGLVCPPLGINFHGLNAFQLAPSIKSAIENKILFRQPIIYNLKNSDFVFSLGGKLSDILNHQGIQPSKTIEIPIGIDASWLNPPNGTPDKIRKFIFIGRYDRLKGIEELNICIREIMADKTFEFYFIGPIPEKNQIKAENIKYWGLLKNQDEIKDILKTCDVLVCPSYSEGMPTVILEAMACSLTVIASDVGAVSCIVNHENAWLIKPGDIVQLRLALLEVIDMDFNTLSVKKNKCHELIKSQYLWGNIIKKTIDQLEEKLKTLL